MPSTSISGLAPASRSPNRIRLERAVLRPIPPAARPRGRKSAPKAARRIRKQAERLVIELLAARQQSERAGQRSEQAGQRSQQAGQRPEQAGQRLEQAEVPLPAAWPVSSCPPSRNST